MKQGCSFGEYKELVNSCIEKFKLVLEKQGDYQEMTTAEQVHAICAQFVPNDDFTDMVELLNHINQYEPLFKN